MIGWMWYRRMKPSQSPSVTISDTAMEPPARPTRPKAELTRPSITLAVAGVSTCSMSGAARLIGAIPNPESGAAQTSCRISCTGCPRSGHTAKDAGYEEGQTGDHGA